MVKDGIGEGGRGGVFWVASVMYVILISQVTLPDGVSSPQVSVQDEASSP